MPADLKTLIEEKKLIVKNPYVFTSFFHSLAENYMLFNKASNGCIVYNIGKDLATQAKMTEGDFQETIFWKRQQMIFDRDPYKQKEVDTIKLQQDSTMTVKYERRLGPLEWDPSSFGVQGYTSEAEYSTVFGRMAAEEEFQNKLERAIGAFTGATQNVPELNISAGEVSWEAFVDGLAAFGDQYQRIKCWVMHSKHFFQLMKGNIKNANNLFIFGTVKVMQDPIAFAPIIISDNKSLEDGGILGLTDGAVSIIDDGYYKDTWLEMPGYENIRTLYQAEWNSILGVKGYKYKAEDANKAPPIDKTSDKAMWEKIDDNPKNMGGVIIKVGGGGGGSKSEAKAEKAAPKE